MFFYRVVPPSNVPPEAASLRIWFDGKNIDGSNNSTLVSGTTTNLLDVANRGTAGGSWKSVDGGAGSNYPPLYNSVRPSIMLGNTTGVVRSLGLLSFDQMDSVPSYTIPSVTTQEAAGFMVFSHHTSIEPNRAYIQSITSDIIINNIRSPADTNKISFTFLNGVVKEINYFPTLNTRYCVSWRRNLITDNLEFRIKSDSLVTDSLPLAGNLYGLGKWEPVIGSRFNNGMSQNIFVESFGIWDGSVDLAALETWVSNYYGALG